MDRRFITWLASGIGVLVVASSIFLFTRLGAVSAFRQPAATPTLPSVFAQGVDLQGTPAPQFTLQDQSGATVSLGQFHGRPVVLTFFDSVCPHPDCSLMAQYINWTAKDLGPQSSNVAWVALSVNPWHDTPASATSFLTTRQVTIPLHYLLGSPDQLAPIWNAYHMQAILQSDGIVIHSTGVYVLDAQGQERVFLDEGFDPRVLSNYLHQLLSQSGATAPRGGTSPAASTGATNLSRTVSGYTVNFTATPGKFGTYTFSVTLENAQGDAVGTPVQNATVNMDLSMTNMPMSPLHVVLAPMIPPVPGSYQAQGVVSMLGPWQATVHIQVPGVSQPIQTKFDFTARQ
jgi:protein SCO1/2